jgi:hypothetical protein
VSCAPRVYKFLASVPSKLSLTALYSGSHHEKGDCRLGKAFVPRRYWRDVNHAGEGSGLEPVE